MKFAFPQLSGGARMYINTNSMASNVASNLQSHYTELATSTQRLSTGLRVNSAADDAAGLAIRELMCVDISTLNQGVRNANDAISLIQTADGALAVIDEKLIRMKELAEQAATGTYDSTQRLMIDSEYQAMASEITRIANATDFNGIHLLDGNLSSGTHDGAGMTSTGKMKIHFGTANDSAEDYYYIQIGSCTASSLGLSSAANTMDGLISSLGLVYGGPNQLDNETWWGTVPASVQSQFSPTATAVDYSRASETYSFVRDLNGKMHALVATGTMTVDTYASDRILAEDGSGGMSIATQTQAQEALVTINNAIVSKDKIRASLGALQNRLENTVSNLQTQAENLQSAESRISDVDVASEMTRFVREQILTQSSVAMLSQANSMPKMAMQIIGG